MEHTRAAQLVLLGNVSYPFHPLGDATAAIEGASAARLMIAGSLSSGSLGRSLQRQPRPRDLHVASNFSQTQCTIGMGEVSITAEDDCPELKAGPTAL